ncbi:membrane hypothetical protein [Vibrio nigripulchritudo MADA3029]|uniref:hypothetical protein n=1 Tax=Vibrio nigripulchritudo TaxID=28173 RepID=UPI0003B21164|nr:hypothetical protein [Vibrio nigripulchritudo]CCN47654.1 membrane hypothetical protein [Vibrio nigripulchritudo MADA3020]CCN56523.1 membrane hypothetical protein [Vibrio nigripulchritudo MADA3021]CCN58853.1 membrane hypothetical protein [Vibrio nigripulchritudo MADA3029]
MISNKTFTDENNYFTIFLYSVSFIIIFVLFIENFIFSKNFGYLGFREIDDIAFQYSIRKSHLDIMSGDFKELFFLNDYAYGWIFWIVVSLVTFPFFLISHFYLLDWPLIVAPRQLSLLFTILSMIVLRKIIKSFGCPEWVAASTVLIFIMLPSSAYFSMRFGTVSMVAFFSIFTIYLSSRNAELTQLELNKVAFSLAISGAVKLTGLLITPLIFTLILIRLKPKKISKSNMWMLIKGSMVFLVAFLLLSSPQLPYIVFYPEKLIAYLNNIRDMIGNTRIVSGSGSVFERFYFGVFGTHIIAFIFFSLIIGIIFEAVKFKLTRVYFLTILLFSSVIYAYVGVTVNNSVSIGSYLTCISPMLLIGLVGISKIRGSIFIILGLIFMLLVDAFYRAQNSVDFKDLTSGNLSHISYFIKEDANVRDVKLAKETYQCIANQTDVSKIGHIFIDFSIPSFFNSLSMPNTCVSFAWNNLSYEYRYCNKPVDYLILDTSSVGYLPEIEFNKKIERVDSKTALSYNRDRNSRRALENTGIFGNQTFELLCDLGKTKVFVSN